VKANEPKADQPLDLSVARLVTLFQFFAWKYSTPARMRLSV